MSESELSETRSQIVRAGDGAKLLFSRATLLVEAGPEAGLEHELKDQPVILGRGDTADLRLDDPTVSREHVRLEPEGGGWTIRDLGSKSGTIVDGVKIETAALAPDQRVRVGETEFRIRVESAELTAPSVQETTFEGILGESAAMRELFGLIRKVGPLELPVLLHGESGTGKERLAHALHATSSVKEGPYVVVDCTLLGEGEHMRSELFGHVKGAFTGADRPREGAFVRANGGTLFLDEVGELPMSLQPQLLRVLQEGEVRPLGGTAVHRTRVRVVGATNKDLAAMVDAGDFRQDLYYRLSAISIDVPALRDRGQDVLQLARHFLPDGVELASDAESRLLSHSWPGNVRELEFTLQQAAALCEGGVVKASDLRIRSAGPSPSPGAPVAGAAVLESQRARVARLTDDEIRAALEKTGGNRNEAAKLLGVSRATLFRKLKGMKDVAGGD